MSAIYYKGSDLPNTSVEWKDDAGSLIDFSSGWTFQVKVGQPDSDALFTKTSGVSGSASSPNVTIAWATTGELNSLDAGKYVGQIKATRSSDSKERFMTFDLFILHTIT